MVTIRVEAAVEDLQRELRHVAREQLPFTVAQSLTKVAQLARDRAHAEMHRRFTIRSQRVIRGVTIQPARKRDWPRTHAIVGTRDAFMARQFLGGVKRPEKGSRTVAVPTKKVAQRRTKTGKIPKRLKPRQVRERKGARRTRSLILVSKGGRRSVRGTGVFYVLVRRARIPMRMDFVDVVEREAAASFGNVFRRRLRANIKGAR